MDPEIERWLTACGGATSRKFLLRAGVRRHDIDTELRRGSLVSAFRGGLLRPEDQNDPVALETAAIFAADGPCLVSHLSALRQCGIADPPPEVHLCVLSPRHLSAQPGLVVHRARRLPTYFYVRRGRGKIAYATPAEAVVQSWGILPAAQRREPAITSVRKRIVTAADLSAALDRHPRLDARAELRDLIGLLASGCESELEIWGVLRVFNIPGIDHGVQQHWVRTARGNFRLDRAYEAEMVAVEMDGDRYHSTRAQREYDRTRDAALSAAGWVVLRFSWQRLTTDPEGCRQELLATLAMRRRQFGI